MLEDFLSPIDLYKISNNESYKNTQWGSLISIYQKEGELPELEDKQIAIIGVQEDRSRMDEHPGCKAAPDIVRRELYQLYNWEKQFGLVDLGNIKSGQTQKDTYFAVQMVVKTLLQAGIVPLIIGGTHDVSYGQFLGHEDEEKMVNVAVFDEKIDLFSRDLEVIDEASFLYRLLSKESFLFNFSHIGYQRYLVDPAMLDTLEKLHFECYSLGQIRENIREVEPVIRNAHMVSFDVSAIRFSEAPGTDHPSPHGFHGEEACRIARYAGMSDHVSSFGIYQYNPQNDIKQQTAKLLAQVLWYFVDGFYSRKFDHPEHENESDFMKYMVHLSDNDYVIHFIKSKKSDRWWMRVPVTQKGEESRYHLIPCSYNDYEMALKDELPDRWLKSYLRLSGY